MGCTGSTIWSRRRRISSDKQVEYDRHPKVSVRMQTHVKKMESTPTIIFIFGGPGSRKGCIVDDLVTAYNLVHICTEEILFQELPKKLPTAKLDSVSDMKTLLEADPSQVTLGWVLDIIQQRISSDLSAQYLIDFIPNLKYMIRAQFLKEECTEAFEKFEQTYPISFALNLAIPIDRVGGSARQAQYSTKELAAMKDTGGKGDEVDISKLQKRASMYVQSSRHLLDYFSATERLVTVDVKCGVSQLIWHQVHDTLCKLDFFPHRTVNTVLLFLFDGDDFCERDYEKYLMEEINLQRIVEDTSSVESLLLALTEHIDKSSKKTDSFVVNTKGTIIAAKNALQKASYRTIVFMDIHEGYLETYLPGSPKNYVPSSGSRKYKAVSSLENEVCLFPIGTSDELCTTIALHLAQNRFR